MSIDEKESNGTSEGIPLWGLITIILISALFVVVVIIIIYMLYQRKKQSHEQNENYSKIAVTIPGESNDDPNYAQVELVSSSKNSKRGKNKKKDSKSRSQIPPEQNQSPVYADIRDVKGADASYKVQSDHGYANVDLPSLL